MAHLLTQYIYFLCLKLLNTFNIWEYICHSHEFNLILPVLLSLFPVYILTAQAACLPPSEHHACTEGEKGFREFKCAYINY